MVFEYLVNRALHYAAPTQSFALCASVFCVYVRLEHLALAISSKALTKSGAYPITRQARV